MASKLIIRRAGGFLPALCLAGLVLLTAVFIWLSTAGLPGWVLRDIEAAASERGVHLRLQRLKLSPASGLALRARGVDLYARKDDAKPLAHIDRATVGIRFTSLLMGEFSPHMAEFRGLRVELPTSQGEPLTLSDGAASASISRSEVVRIENASCRLGGITLRLGGAFRLSDLLGEESGDDEPLDLPALIRPHQEKIDLAQRTLADQQWTRDEEPRVDLRVETVLSQQLACRASVPRFDEGQFHIRDAVLDVVWQQDALILNMGSFRTIEPEATVKLQGGYDIRARQVSLSLDSSAALTRMAESIEIPGVDMESARSWLRLFKHPDDDPPRITLRGDACFDEEFALKSLSASGTVRQKDFAIGGTPVNEMDLSFYYRDGTFNIDRLQIQLPKGSLLASASATDGEKGRARLEADVDIPQLLGLVNEFTAEPVFLPIALHIKGNLKLSASAELDMPSFTSGSTDLGQFLPALHDINLTAGVGSLSYLGVEAENPTCGLFLDHIVMEAENLVPTGAETAQADLQADSLVLSSAASDAAPVKLEKPDLSVLCRSLRLGLGEGEAPSARKAEIRLKMDAAELPVGEETLRARRAALSAQLEDVSCEADDGEGGKSPCIGAASVLVQAGRLYTPDFDAGGVELTLAEARKVRPLADWREMVEQASLRLVTKGMQTGGVELGALDGALELKEGSSLSLDLSVEREGSKLTLHALPELQPDGILALNDVRLRLPAAGFEPLLALTGVSVTQIRMPELVTLAGHADIDTREGRLREASARLSIPHLVRTPGDVNPVFRGLEIPLALRAQADAKGTEDGGLSFTGTLSLTHKAGDPDKPDDRRLDVSFTADSGGHARISGTSDIDLTALDQIIDSQDAHEIIRDFRTTSATRTHVDILQADVDFSDGIDVRATCDAAMDDFGYQMNAIVAKKDADGKPTGEESPRTDFGKDPFCALRSLRGRVDIHRRKNFRDANGESLPNASLITITQPDLVFDNRPWQKRQKFKSGATESRLRGDKVVIDVEHSFVELTKVKGTIYPAYSIGCFYDDLPGFMEVFALPEPGLVETEHSLFPIYDDCKRDMEGCIRLLADRADFHFLNTVFPLTRFSGFIWLREGSVYLDRLNAACWDGVIDAAVNIDYTGEHTGFDGYADIKGIDLRRIAAAYGGDLEKALCRGKIRFRTPSSELKDIRAYGDFHVTDGDLLAMNIFQPVGELVSDMPKYFTELEKRATLHKKGATSSPGWVARQADKELSATGKLLGRVGDITNNIPFANHFLRYDLQEAHGNFDILGGKLYTNNMKALGYNLNVGLDLTVDLDSLALSGNLWPKMSSVPTILLSPLTFLSDYMIDIHIYGKVDDIKWRIGLDSTFSGDKSKAPAAKTHTPSATDKPDSSGLKPKRP